MKTAAAFLLLLLISPSVLSQEQSFSDWVVELRAEAADLAQDWSSLARWAYGGKALLQDHPVNRLARESWQYGVTALRPADLEAIYPSP